MTTNEKLEQFHQDGGAHPWAEVCIYRVPRYLREGGHENTYPQTVSLGPYHHGTVGREHLLEMEPHKRRSLEHILKRTGQDFEDYLDSIKEVEKRARDCYEGTITHLNTDQFVEMMVLDGCFILELFRGTANDDGDGFIRLGYSPKDPIFRTGASMHSFRRDMIMLENQIPLFILDRLLALQDGEPEPEPKLGQKSRVAKLALQFLHPLISPEKPLTQSELDSSPVVGGLHCLHVFRQSLLVSDIGSHAVDVADHKRKGRRQKMVRGVTELREGGIRFKKGEKTDDPFWKIEFNPKNGILRIPRLLIHHGTKPLFLNLVAFEQCHPGCTNKITSYVIFMDNLINSAADVAHLNYREIIEHWCGCDDEVAGLFNRQLCQELVFDIKDSYLSELSNQVKEYRENKCHGWRASLMLKYFNSPWTIISFLAGVLLLLLSLTNTFFGVYRYYKPNP